MIKKEELAQLLNGRQYRSEMTSEEEELAKENDLLVFFGQSDDLLELRGLIHDEVDASCGSGTAFIVLKKDNEIGLIQSDDKDLLEETFKDNDLVFKLPIVEIDAMYCKEEFPQGWLIKSKIPSASFDLMEDGYVHCKGIVVEKADLMKELIK